MSTGKVIGAAWVPGLPFILQPEKSKKWAELTEGMEKLATHIKALKPDVVLVYSTQWFSVLGTSFQVRPQVKGLHVDENWYEWGDLPFDFKCDSTLGEKFAAAVTKKGFPTKTVDYEEFPIDTGTIVASRFLKQAGDIPVSIVSSWVYADADKSCQIGEAMREEILASGKKVFVLASSLLSTRYFTDEINPEDDRISNAEDEAWNQKILKVFQSGNLLEGRAVAEAYAKSGPRDMQFNAYHWLSGVLAKDAFAGELLAYGPQWGTGAAVIEFTKKD